VQVLGGKLAGSPPAGSSQMDDPPGGHDPPLRADLVVAAGVVLLTIALVLAATAWGILIAAWAARRAKRPRPGTAITLVFAIVGGNFLPAANMPEPLRTASLLTPNAWGIDGYGALLSGGTLDDIALGVAALLGDDRAPRGRRGRALPPAPGGQVRASR